MLIRQESQASDWLRSSKGHYGSLLRLGISASCHALLADGNGLILVLAVPGRPQAG
jgi:hypothetical protein